MGIKKSIAMLLTAIVITGVGINGQLAEAGKANKAVSEALAQKRKEMEEFGTWFHSQSKEYQDSINKIMDEEPDGRSKAFSISWDDFLAWKTKGKKPVIKSHNNAMSQNSGSSINLSQYARAAEYSNKMVQNYSNLFINASSHKIISLIYESEREYSGDWGRKEMDEAKGVPLKYQRTNQVLRAKDFDNTDYVTDSLGFDCYSKYPMYPGEDIESASGRAWAAHSENKRVIALLDNNKVVQTRFLMCEDVAYVITDTGIERLAIPEGNGSPAYKMRGLLSQLQHTGPSNYAVDMSDN